MSASVYRSQSLPKKDGDDDDDEEEDPEEDENVFAKVLSFWHWWFCGRKCKPFGIVVVVVVVLEILFRLMVVARSLIAIIVD